MLIWSTNTRSWHFDLLYSASLVTYRKVANVMVVKTYSQSKISLLNATKVL